MDTTLAQPLTLPRTLGGWTRGVPLAAAVAGTALVLLAAQTLVPVESRTAELLLRRGWTQPLTQGLFFWGLGHVVRRWLVQQGVRGALERSRRLVWRRTLTRDDVPRYIEALHSLRHSLAGSVLHSVLGFFLHHRPTRDEVLEAAGKAVDRAYDRVDADDRALSATLWLLPLSGFLGTVVGMAEAIGTFDQVIGAMGADLGALVPAVAGLAKAFDTTLLALALVVPLKLLEVGIHGRDRRLLEDIDASVGAGLVAELDLGILAQLSPAQAALEQQADTVARIEASLGRIDATLVAITQRMEAQPSEVLAALEAIGEAAQVTRDAVPAIRAEVEALRAHSERPLVVSRGEK